MAETDSERYTVPGLERGLRILGEFSRRESVLTPPELARRLGVPRSTVFRLLVTLENLGFVERTPDGRAYRLGVAVLRLGFEYLASLDMVELGRPIVDALRDDTGYAASLVVRDGRDIVYLYRAASRSPFATAVTVGTRLPAHATVLGHVLLSDLSLAALRALYPEARLESTGPHTPATVTALFDLVQQVRQRGWVMAEGFFERHISTIAAPVRDRSGHVVAAVGLTVPGGEIPAAAREALPGRVREAARALSALLDHHGDAGDVPPLALARKSAA
ncbi:MAG: IclR family transcriptional regulator [Burkholderiales bacterium]|nr:IclR family transcriptional regulator [Burkholderiales bacterium]